MRSKLKANRVISLVVLQRAKQGSELPLTHHCDKIKLQLVIEYRNRLLDYRNDTDAFKICNRSMFFSPGSHLVRMKSTSIQQAVLYSLSKL
jgi:hypothetical protein